jgi:hypothetical protein
MVPEKPIKIMKSSIREGQPLRCQFSAVHGETVHFSVYIGSAI